ncbi:MAG: wax ester/triacylglycerol synthase family O-acyltransferase [Burkholderiales bacterium]|nr:wax ester/triacylglycerol synthase family O-acyltransferase [Burkholderiales bacterium]
MAEHAHTVGGLETLSGVDGVFLNLESAATPMHVGSLHLFEAPPGHRGSFYSAVRRMMASRMVPVLRRHLATLPLGLANPVWRQGEVDLDHHICRVQLPKPGTWAQLETVVADLHAELLDRSRPLWKLYVLEGLSSGHKAYYIKVHHAMLDGQAGVALAGALFNTSPSVPTRQATAPAPTNDEPIPSKLAVATAAFRHDAAQYIKLVRELPGAFKTLAGVVRQTTRAAVGATNENAAPAADRTAEGGPGVSLRELKRSMALGPRTLLNVAIEPGRRFATAEVPRADLKAIASAHSATVNDVVLAICSGALRRYLKRHASVPRKSLIASMPISLREAGNTDMRTQATLSLVSLASHKANPIERLLAIRDSAGATKALTQHSKAYIPTDVPLLGAPWLVGALAALYGRKRVVDTLPILANVLVSNVPGPPVPLYVANYRMTGYWPLSIVEHGVGLNITLVNYAGTLYLGFVAASNAVPDVRELADDFMAAYAELTACHQTPAAPPPAPDKPTRRRAAPRKTAHPTPQT